MACTRSSPPGGSGRRPVAALRQWIETLLAGPPDTRMADWKVLQTDRTWFIPAAAADAGNEKVCFIFGWTGGSKKNVAKYSQYWLEKGWNCIIHLAVYDSNIFRSSKQDGADVASLVDWVISNNLTTHGNAQIVVMSFSNGGLHQVDSFLTRLTSLGHEFAVPRAWILDSSPGMASRNIRPFGEFLIQALGFKRRSWVAIASGYTVAIVLTVLLSIVSLWRFMLAWWMIKDRAKADEWIRETYGKTFRDSVQGVVVYPQWKSVPRLFLYSDADLLIPLDGPRDAMRRVTQQGGKAMGMEFKGSEHVRHAVAYPDAYWQEITVFINNL